MKHIVGFSGGIDSQACARWVLNRYPAEDVILLNSDAGGNEHPLTVEFIKWYSENVHPVVMIHAIAADMWAEGSTKPQEKGLDPNAPLDFEGLIRLKGRAPSTKARFCTEILKLKPQKRWIAESFGPVGPYAGEDFERYAGVRRQESEARKDTPIRAWDGFYDCWLNSPIADWTKRMCFDYAKHHGERINELYTLGFGRVGCAPCINSGKDDILNWHLRFPEMLDKIRGWEQRVGRTFFSPMVPGMYTNTVDDVIEWAKTARGGRQQQFLVMHERPACESKYGLCE